MRQQDQAWHWFVVIKLRDETIEHLFDSQRPVGFGIVGAIAPVLAGAEEKHLNAGLPALLVGCKNIGLFDAVWIDRLIGGDVGQRPQSVAILGSVFELLFFCSLVHQALIHIADSLTVAAHAPHGLIDQLVVVWKRDFAGAGRRAAFDLMEQARPCAVFIIAIGAGAELKRAL